MAAAAVPARTPPFWFTIFAAVLPALPYCAFVRPQPLLLWLPLWVVLFYMRRVHILSPLYALPQLQPMLLMTWVVTWRELTAAGWSMWASRLLCLPLGFLQNLVQSALWDSFEPLLIGDPTHGVGMVRQIPIPSAPSEFTKQEEVELLAARGDPNAQAALKASKNKSR